MRNCAFQNRLSTELKCIWFTFTFHLQRSTALVSRHSHFIYTTARTHKPNGKSSSFNIFVTERQVQPNLALQSTHCLRCQHNTCQRFFITRFSWLLLHHHLRHAPFNLRSYCRIYIGDDGAKNTLKKANILEAVRHTVRHKKTVVRKKKKEIREAPF